MDHLISLAPDKKKILYRRKQTLVGLYLVIERLFYFWTEEAKEIVDVRFLPIKQSVKFSL